MAEQETMYAAAKRLVKNMRDEGLTKGMFMRMMGCDEATAMSLIAGMEREGAVEPGFWANLSHEHGWEPLTGRIFKGIAHPGERIVPAADNQARLREIFDSGSALHDVAQALKDGSLTLSDVTDFFSSEQPRAQGCSSCGKPPLRIAFVGSDHELTLKCDCAPPQMPDFRYPAKPSRQSPWWWPFKPRPIVVDFSHIVCKPGDVVCVALPAGMSENAVRQFRDAIEGFRKEHAVEIVVFADGIRITGVEQ